MSRRMLVIGTSVVAVLLLVGVGVFVLYSMNAPDQPVKVYELPDSRAISVRYLASSGRAYPPKVEVVVVDQKN